jgi:predicted unusual protein kinase regulating ubiquinone biosynthesis (AarF/ABC1/UbiB family)
LKQKEDRQALLSGKSVSRLSPANQVKEKAEFFSKRPEKFAIDFAKLNQCLIEHGIISFDLHPDNLGRTQDGTLIALDLGTSMFLEE